MMGAMRYFAILSNRYAALCRLLGLYPNVCLFVLSESDLMLAIRQNQTFIGVSVLPTVSFSAYKFRFFSQTNPARMTDSNLKIRFTKLLSNV